MNERVIVVRSPLPPHVAIANLRADLVPEPFFSGPWTPRLVRGHAVPEGITVRLGRGRRFSSPRLLRGTLRPIPGGCEFVGTLTTRFSWTRVLLGLLAMSAFSVSCGPYTSTSLFTPAAWWMVLKVMAVLSLPLAAFLLVVAVACRLDDKRLRQWLTTSIRRAPLPPMPGQ
jgi:hypothetical protein